MMVQDEEFSRVNDYLHLDRMKSHKTCANDGGRSNCMVSRGDERLGKTVEGGGCILVNHDSHGGQGRVRKP